LNPNALDYSKCLETSASASASTENSINTKDELGTTMNYSTFVKIIGKEIIEKFERIKDFLSGENEDFFTLFCMWECFQNGREQDTFSYSNDGKIQNENQSLTSNGNDLNIPTGTHDGGERITADHDVNLESGTPKVDNRKSLPAEGSCSNLSGRQSMCSRASSVARVVSTEYMSEFLVWPDTPKHKGKRRVERQPFAITSVKYQKMFQKKYFTKAAEEEKKQGWKRKREEAKQNKKNKVLKHADKRKFFKEVNDNVECNSVCHICKRRIKRGCELRCDDFQNLYHESCIPKYHTKHIPILEDGDTFLCHSCYKEENTDNSADEMTHVEENYDHYDSDLNELYMTATQK
jgi:hypothetical protein